MRLKNPFLFFAGFLILTIASSATAQTIAQRFGQIGSTHITAQLQDEFSEPIRGPATQEQRETSRRKTVPTKDTAQSPTEFSKPNALKKPKPSALETLYSTRIVDELHQFGYDLFGVPSQETQQQLSAIRTKPSGAVQDDFILGSGDELEVMFTGQRNDRRRYSVNDQGTLLIQDFPPIPAAGRSIGQVRLSIQSVAGTLYNTEAFVSLANVRQINVLVIGDVKRPGRQTLTVFHTVLDALMQAGGVNKDGSLRQIKLVRDGRSTIIDIYGLLMHGNTAMDIALRDGDRILIPAIGPTVAIAGEVKRPGVYEILPP